MDRSLQPEGRGSESVWHVAANHPMMEASHKRHWTKLVCPTNRHESPFTVLFALIILICEYMFNILTKETFSFLLDDDCLSGRFEIVSDCELYYILFSMEQSLAAVFPHCVSTAALCAFCCMTAVLANVLFTDPFLLPLSPPVMVDR